MTGFCDDAEIPTWAKGSAVSALQCGLIRGVGTEGGMAFCADEGVTLSEAATVLNRLLRVTDVDLSDYDAGSADAWSAQAVANLESVRVIESGSFSAGDFAPLRSRAARPRRAPLAAMTLAERSRRARDFFRAYSTDYGERRRRPPFRLLKGSQEFRVRRRESDMIRFLPRPVRGRKHVARSSKANCPLSADKPEAQSAAKIFSKAAFATFLTRKAKGRLSFACNLARRCAKVYSDKIA